MSRSSSHSFFRGFFGGLGLLRGQSPGNRSIPAILKDNWYATHGLADECDGVKRQGCYITAGRLRGDSIGVQWPENMSE
jgi:hypothetical protein